MTYIYVVYNEEYDYKGNPSHYSHRYFKSFNSAMEYWLELIPQRDFDTNKIYVYHDLISFKLNEDNHIELEKVELED